MNRAIIIFDAKNEPVAQCTTLWNKWRPMKGSVKSIDVFLLLRSHKVFPPETVWVQKKTAERLRYLLRR